MRNTIKSIADMSAFPDDRILAFYWWLLRQEGVPYIYGGKGPFLDCSGAVTCGLFVASHGDVDWRGTHNSAKLYDILPKTCPDSVVLCFYGKPRVNHVMVRIPQTSLVFGACGGDSSTIRVTKGAQVQWRPRPGYRKDYIGDAHIPRSLLYTGKLV